MSQLTCPDCGYGPLAWETWEETLSHCGLSETIEVTGACCPKCGEVVLDNDSYDKWVKAQECVIDGGRE